MIEDEVYSFALKNALTEMKNLCPDVTHSFIFTYDGEIVAGDDTTNNKTMTQVVDSFNGIFEKANSIGGIDTITLQTGKGRIQVYCIDKNLYMLIVASKKADMTYINTVSRVLIPTILKILEKLNPTSLKNIPSPKIEIPKTKPKPKLEKETSIPIETSFSSSEQDVEEKLELEISSETLEPEKPKIEEPLPEELPELPTHQLIVDTIGGLLVRGDTVQIDKEILDEWEQLWEDKEVTEIMIETFNGETVKCKVKPITDSKLKGKGLIRIPEKLRRKLDIKKGELVRITPVIELGEGE